MRTAWNKKSIEEIKNTIENLGYFYIDSYYKNNKHRRVIVQDKIGYKYDSDLNSLILKHVPKTIDIRNPFTLSHNIPLWLKLNKSQFKLFEKNEYKGHDSKLNFYCNKCKDYPKITWDSISQKQGCGICEGRQTGIYHNLAAQRPDIAKEWHPIKNGKLTPKHVTYGSTKKVWWLCLNGHSYFSSVNDRTSSGNGCKTCSDAQKESKIATELKRYILNKYDSKEEYLIFKNPKTNRLLPYDIYIYGGQNPEVNGVYIEVHWDQHYKIGKWHKQIANKKGTSPEEEFEYQKHKDRLKRRFARKNGTYIEIDLRKIKTTKQAIEYIESILETL